MKKFAWILATLLAQGCAVPSKGILLSVEPATPLDERDLHSYCDLGDRAACALSGPVESARPAITFPIVQGVATSDRAVFAAVLPKDSAVSWFVYDRDVGRLWKLFDSRKQMRPGISSYVQRIEVRGLEPARKYELLAGDGQGNLVESRSFQTLSAERKLSFAAVSGLASAKPGIAERLLIAAKAQLPQIVLLTGGNLNASMAREKLPAKRAGALDFFFERHLAARKGFALAHQRDLVPIAATWSDDEFGLKRGDRSFAYRDQAREVFEMFFPFWADEATVVNGPGLSKSIRLGDHNILLLDDRSFRVPGPLPPDCDPKKKKRSACNDAPQSPPTLATRLGSMQSEWAFRQSAKTRAQNWLIVSEPWLGIYQSRGAAPATSAEWLDRVASRPAPPSLSAADAFAFVESESGKSSLSIVNASGTVVSSREIAAN